jgi:hypothetical protein
MYVSAAAALCGIAAVAGVAAVAPGKKASAPAVDPGSKYGALAVDRAKGFIYGWSYDQPNLAEAVTRSLQECKDRGGNCSTVLEFAGPGCGAYQTISAEDGSAYGWGTATTKEDAQNRALAECNKYAGAKSCSNFVWSCNSGEGKFVELKNEPARLPPAKTDCLVQYELQVYRDKDWKSRFYSPVYRLAAKDCPLPGKSQYHSFGHKEWPGDKPETWEVNEDRKNPAKKARGFEWAESFFSWAQQQRSPFGGYNIPPTVDMHVTDATPDNIKSMTEDVAKQDAGDSAGITVGWCIAHTPPAAAVEILGAEKCRRWFG